MSRSTPGLPVHHQLPELTQTHAHRVSDAIQPSHPLLSPSPPAPNPSQPQGLFQWVNSSHEVAKVLEFQLQHQSFQWSWFRLPHLAYWVYPHQSCLQSYYLQPKTHTDDWNSSFNKLLLRTCGMSGDLSFMGLRRYNLSLWITYSIKDLKSILEGHDISLLKNDQWLPRPTDQTLCWRCLETSIWQTP